MEGRKKARTHYWLERRGTEYSDMNNRTHERTIHVNYEIYERHEMTGGEQR